MRPPVRTVLCIAIAACDAGARAPAPTAPLSGSAPPAAAPSVPAGWVPISPTEEQRRCGNRSDDDLQVAIDSGRVVATKLANREADTGPSLAFEPKAGEVRGRRHTLAFGDGYLVGFDAGEWGGSLSWFARDGSGAQKLGDENVHGLVTFGPDLAASLEGLAHLSINEGAVRWIDRAGATVHAAKPVPLPDEPQAFTPPANGSAYVLTWTSVVKLTADRHVDVVHTFPNEVGYSNSIAVDGDGALWIGTRLFLLRLTPTGSRFTETWFVRENCQHMQVVDMACVCH